MQKSESEIAIENRLAELEKAQEEVNAQKAFLSLQDTLQGKGIDKALATFLKADVDVDAFVTAFNNAMKEVTKDKGYVRILIMQVIRLPPKNLETGLMIRERNFIRKIQHYIKNW